MSMREVISDIVVSIRLKYIVKGDGKLFRCCCDELNPNIIVVECSGYERLILDIAASLLLDGMPSLEAMQFDHPVFKNFKHKAVHDVGKISGEK